MKTGTFRDLTVWQKAHALVLNVYEVTRSFPSEERYGLTSQMRRAAVSIAANLAEGSKKRTRNDQANFYNIAQGSLEELRYYLLLSRDLQYLPDGQELDAKLDEIGRMLHALAAACRRRFSKL